MERRVIKFNLVGTIIVGSIIAVIRTINLLDLGKKNNENNTSQEQTSEQPAEPEVKDKIKINGEIQEIVINTHRSEKLLYTLSYVPEFFEIERVSNQKEIIKLKETEDVTIEIERFAEGFINKSEELITSEAKKKREDSSYSMNTVNLNGRLCYIEKRIKDEDLYMEYTIEYEQSYYVVNIHIAKNYINEYQQIVEKMLNEFRVI